MPFEGIGPHKMTRFHIINRLTLESLKTLPFPVLEMNFTLSDIRDYLSSHGLEKTIELFNKEMDRIDETISKLLLIQPSQ